MARKRPLACDLRDAGAWADSAVPILQLFFTKCRSWKPISSLTPRVAKKVEIICYLVDDPKKQSVKLKLDHDDITSLCVGN